MNNTNQDLKSSSTTEYVTVFGWLEVLSEKSRSSTWRAGLTKWVESMTRLRFWIRMILSAVFLMEAPTPAHAYLDPGTGSMMLQALLGAIAASSVIGGLYWQKIKSFFSRAKDNPDDDNPTEESDSQ